MVICVVIEAVLLLGDYGVIDVTRLRQTAYEFGGFWPGLLAGWQPNYAIQPYAMFFTYAFLHGGLLHLIINMITLWSLGTAVTDRAEIMGFLLIYLASVLGGALVYAALAQAPLPMVGASGALFGLAGALIAWNLLDRIALRESLWPLARVGLLLVLINIVMWWALDGNLAWQTHLGGFVSGALMGWAVARDEPDAA